MFFFGVSYTAGPLLLGLAAVGRGGVLSVLLPFVKKPDVLPGTFYTVAFFAVLLLSVLERCPACRKPPSEVPLLCRALGLAWWRQRYASGLLVGVFTLQILLALLLVEFPPIRTPHVHIYIRT